MIYQGNDYPNGCESVSAVMALRYVGVDITVDSFISDYLTMSPLPQYVDGLGLVAETPANSFIGDPRSSSGYYCYSTVIGNALNKFIDLNTYSCDLLYGVNMDTLCHTYLDNGIPVVVWVTVNMTEPRYTGTTWHVNGTEEIHNMYGNLHCVLLVGYDEQYYFFNDGLKGCVSYSKSAVEYAYTKLGNQAIVIYKK